MNIFVTKRLFFQAITVSLFLNIVMVSLPLLTPDRSHSLFTRVSDAIAIPPGKAAGMAFAPKQHTTNAFVLASLESFLFSIVFYTVVAWLILGCVGLIRIRFQTTKQ